MRTGQQSQDRVRRDREVITRREATILEILVSRERYGLEIADAYGRETGQAMPLGSLYTTMDRIVAKGLAESRLGDPNPERGGNRRRYYRVTGEGREALKAFRDAQEAAQLKGRKGAWAHA